MPMNLNIKKQLGSFLKLRCLISIFGEENEVFSDEISVNGLAILRLKFYTKNSLNALETYVTTKQHVKAIDEKIKLKISCHEMDDPLYLELDCQNNEEDKKIGKKFRCDIDLNDVRTCFLNIIISASKGQDGALTKLYDDVDFTDFNLGSENGSVAVHRAVLAAHSDVFKAMLSREWKEASEGFPSDHPNVLNCTFVQIRGVTLETLQHLKQYMYLGILSKEGLQPLLLLASYYLIEDLKAECISSLALTAEHENLCSLFKFATENNVLELLSAITLVNPACVLAGTEIKVNKKCSE